MNRIKSFLYKYLEDILIFGGLLFIIIATFMLSKTLGIYATGVIMLGLGMIFSRYPPKKG